VLTPCMVYGLKALVFALVLVIVAAWHPAKHP